MRGEGETLLSEPLQFSFKCFQDGGRDQCTSKLSLKTLTLQAEKKCAVGLPSYIMLSSSLPTGWS